MTGPNEDDLMVGDHHFTPDMYDRAEREYAAICEELVDSDDNSADIETRFDEWVTDEHGENAYTHREISVALAAALRTRIKSRARSRAAKVLECLALGKWTLTDFTEHQWQPLIVDNERRTTVRNCTADDIKRMVRTRSDNMRRQALAFEQFQDWAEQVIGALEGHRTLGDLAQDTLPKASA